MKVYVAGSFVNKDDVRVAQAAVVAAGHTITFDWTVIEEYDDNENTPARVAQRELDAIIASDVTIVLPGRLGTHIEIGIALGAGVRIVLVGYPSMAGAATQPPFYALCAHARDVAEAVSTLRVWQDDVMRIENYVSEDPT